jgi:ketosteroid isomerase-like protein
LNPAIVFRLVVLLAAVIAAPAASADWSADETEIRRQLAASTDAFNRADLPGHLAIYDAGVTFMTKEGPRSGIEPIEKAFRENYFRDGKAIQQLRFEALAIRPLGPDVALATARWTLSGGDKPDQSGWFTLVLQRGNAGWRAVHDHSS